MYIQKKFYNNSQYQLLSRHGSGAGLARAECSQQPYRNAARGRDMQWSARCVWGYV